MPFLRTLSTIGIVVSSFVVSSVGALPASAHQRGHSRARSLSIDQRHHLTISPLNWARVTRVHMCEQSNWHAVGPTYSGGLGFLNSTWSAWRLGWMPANMGAATPLEQATTMVRFVDQFLHYWPHQGWPAYCGAGY